jgi:hypothetical protein
MSHFILSKRKTNYGSLHVSVSMFWSNQPNCGRYHLFPGYFVLLKFISFPVFPHTPIGNFVNYSL